MAVMVDIPGVGQVRAENAAEESTLREILKALKGRGGSGGGGGGLGGGGGAGGPGGISNVLDGLGNDMKDFGKSIINTTNVLQDFASGVKSIASSITGIFMDIAGAGLNLAKEFLTGGNKMSDFTQHIPIVGNMLSGLAGIVEQNVDTFRSLSEVGASFGNNVATMNLAASNAGLGMEKFAEFVGQNSERMQLLGGTVTEGASQFGTLIKNVRNSGKDFFGMGYTMESLNEHTAEYIEMQARQGRLAGMSQAELQKGSEDYLEQIDRLAKITGKSRKEAEALLKQQQAEANILVLKSKLEGENLKNFENNMAFVQSELPGLANAFGDMADGVAQTPLAKMLAANVPGLQDLQKQMGDGTISQGEYIARLKQLMPAIQEFGKGMGAAGTSALMGKEGMGDFLGAMGDVNNFLAKGYDPKKAEAEQKQRDKMTSEIAGFENAIAGMRAKIMETFINSGLFKKLQDGLGDLFGWFTDEGSGATDKVNEFFDSFLTEVDEFTGWLKNAWGESDGIMDFLGKLWDEKIKPMMSEAWDGIISNMIPDVGTMIAGALGAVAGLAGAVLLGAVVGPIAAPFLAIAGALAAIFGWEKIKEWFGAAWDMLQGVFKWIGDAASALWDNIKPLVDFIWDIYKGMFGWIGDTFKWIWEYVEPVIMGIYNAISGMFGWIGDTIEWIWKKIKALNPFSWFSDDDDEDEAEDKIANKKDDKVGLSADERAKLNSRQKDVPKSNIPKGPTAPDDVTPAIVKPTMPEVKSGKQMIEETVSSNVELQELIKLMNEQNRLIQRNNQSIKGLYNDLQKGAK